MLLKLHTVETIQAAIAALRDQTDIVILGATFRVVDVKWRRRSSLDAAYADVELMEVPAPVEFTF